MRDYQPQDDLRRIDWKATARTRQLTVREFAAEDEKRVTIILETFVRSGDQKELNLREKIDAEQSGKPVVESPQFEYAASTAASLLTQFAGEKAEVRLIIDDEQGEYGIGRGHLFESLKRLAIARPTFNLRSKEPEYDVERMLDGTDDSHQFLITADTAVDASPEVLQRLKIIGF